MSEEGQVVVLRNFELVLFIQLAPTKAYNSWELEGSYGQ